MKGLPGRMMAIVIFMFNMATGLTAIANGVNHTVMAVGIVVTLAPIVWLFVDTLMDIIFEIFWPEAT